MSRYPSPALPPNLTACWRLALTATLCSVGLATMAVAAPPPPTTQQTQTARSVAQRGVPLSALAPNAPDSYTVKRGDTLWDISKIFLRTPWRWPELWGMNLDQIRNPHLIYPGQVLMLFKSGDRAWLGVAKPLGDAKLSPRVRVDSADEMPLASVSMDVIRHFLNQAVVFDTDALNLAPRIVAAGDERVLMASGDTAYVRGDLTSSRHWQLFRQPVALIDPDNGQTLGYEATYLGRAERMTLESSLGAAASQASEAQTPIVPGSVRLSDMKEEATIGDRLAPAVAPDNEAFAPHAPAADFKCRVISLYGGARIGGNYHVIALNKGKVDGVERGHVMELWRDGRSITDKTSEDAAALAIPPERNGLVFVFRVFDRVSYALVLESRTTVQPGDQLTAP